MAVVHYKFKNSVNYDSVTFDGLSISLRDLKTSILKKKKMRAEDTDLQVINAQTGEEYSSPSLMIPKNTSLIIARIPVGGGKKPVEITPQTKAKKWAAFRKETQAAISAAETGGYNTEKLKQSSDLVNAQSSEIEKIAEMIKQSTKDFDPSNYTYKVGPSGTPNPSYICRRCGKGGHFIQNCTNDPVEGANSPSDVPRMKRPTGIPVDSMVFMDEPLPGTYQTHSGKYALPKIDVAAYVEGKKELPPFLPEMEKKPVVLKKPIPKELKCPLCGDLARDAVVIPCCGISYCDECIRDKLLESEDHVCPSCDSMDVSPDGLIANQMLRRAVTNFQNETGYVNIKQAQAKAAEAAKAAAAATKVLNKIQSAPVVPRGPSVLDYKPPKTSPPQDSQQAPTNVQTQPKISPAQEQITSTTTPQKTSAPVSVEQEPPTPTQDEPVPSSRYSQPYSTASSLHNVSVGEPLPTLVGQVAQPVNRNPKRPVTSGSYDTYYKPSVASTSVPPPTVPPYPTLTAFPPPVVPPPFVPPPVLPVVRPPIGGPPVVPPVFPPALPPRPAVPVAVAPLNLPKPLSETEFLQEKNRILREELQRKEKENDPLLEFAKKLEERRTYRTSRSRSRSPRSRSRSLSRPRYRSRSRGRSFSRSPRRSLTPRRSSLSPRRSYSPRRYSPRRSRSPRYSPRRYYSPRRSRSPRSLSPRNRYRSLSRSPLRRRSYSRSRSWSRKRSPFRRSLSRSPLGRRSPFRRSYSRGRYTPPRRSLSPYRRSPVRRTRSRSPMYRRSRSPGRFSPKRKRSPLKRSPIRRSPPLRRSPQRRSKEKPLLRGKSPSRTKSPTRAKSPKSQRESKRKTQPVKQRDRDQKDIKTVPNDNTDKNTHIKTVEPNKENIPAKTVQSRGSSRSNNILVNLVDTTTTDDNSEIEEKVTKKDDNQNENALSNKDAVSNKENDKADKPAVESKENKELNENENKQRYKSENDKQKSRSRSKSKEKSVPSTKQSNKPKRKKSPKKREKSVSLSPERVKEPLRMPYRDRFERGRGRIEGVRDRFEGGRGGFGRDWDRNREVVDPYYRGRENAGYRGRDFRGRGRGSDFRGAPADYSRGQLPPDFRVQDYRPPPADFGVGFPPIPDSAQYGRDFPRGSPGFPGNYGPNFPYPPPRDPREDPNFQGMVRDEDIVKFEQYKQFYDFYNSSRTYGFPPPPIASAVPSGQTPPQGPPPAPPGTTPLPAPSDRAGSPGRRRSMSPRRHRSRSPGRRDGKERREKERDYRERRSPDRRREDRTDREERSPEPRREHTPEKHTADESDRDAVSPEKKSKENEDKELKKEKKARKKKEKEGGEKKKKKKKDREKTKTKKEKAEKKAKKSKIVESSENEDNVKKKSRKIESQNESDSEKSDSDPETIATARNSRKNSILQSDASDHETTLKVEEKLTGEFEIKVEENSNQIKKENIKEADSEENEKSERKSPLGKIKKELEVDSEVPQVDKSLSQNQEKRRSLKRGKPEAPDTEVAEPKKVKLEETVKEESKEDKMDTSVSPARSEGFDDIPHPEDELMLEPPELSKWEKEEDPYDLSPEPTRKKEKWKPTKQTFLPRSVIEKAEHALAQKVMKPTTVSSAVSVIQPGKKESNAETKDQDHVHRKREKSPAAEPKRRVFMEPEKKEDERRVSQKQHNVKITVTGDEKRKVATEMDLRNKLREKRREGEHSRDYERPRERDRERSPERKRRDSHDVKDRRSSRDYDRQESRGTKSNSSRGRDSGRTFSRKESVIDDSRFVPDYDDSYTDDDNSEDSSSDSSSDEEVVYKKPKHKKNKHKKDKKLKKKKEKKKKKLKEKRKRE